MLPLKRSAQEKGNSGGKSRSCVTMIYISERTERKIMKTLFEECIRKTFCKKTHLGNFAVIVMGFALSWLVLVNFGTDPCTSMNLAISQTRNESRNWQALLNCLLFIIVILWMAVRLGVLFPALAVFVVAAGVYMVTELGNRTVRCYPVSDCKAQKKYRSAWCAWYLIYGDRDCVGVRRRSVW